MNKFTKYAIYFLLGILAYYLLFNNVLVEGFKNSPRNRSAPIAVTSEDLQYLFNACRRQAIFYQCIKSCLSPT